MIVVFKFKVFDKRIKQKATQVAKEFPGIHLATKIYGYMKPNKSMMARYSVYMH